MTHQKPQRPKQHRREDVSKRVFESVIPTTWTYGPKNQREYGVDGIVEIFDNDDTTGLRFNVQLKGGDRESATKALIKTSTRNYLKDLDSPTLVVLVDGSNTVHFGWAHQFDLYGRKKDAASYNFELPNIWNESSGAEIEREVRAARAARHLRSNMPIFWSINADESLSAPWVASFRVSLERGLAGSKELTRRADEAGWATLEISIESDAISIRLRGTPGGVIHFRLAAVESFPAHTIAADVMLGLAFELERGGLDVLVVALIEKSIPESSILGREPDLTSFAITRIIEAGRSDAAVALVERLYLDESLPLRNMVPLQIGRDHGRLDEPALVRIAERIAEHAATAEDERAGEYFYNAGNMIRRIDRARGLEMHELAAERFPVYRTRGYWWRERGEIFFDSGDLKAAVESYEEAARLGEQPAIPLLADAYAATGDYEKAIKTWDGMRDITRYLWLTKMSALRALTTELSISRQNRDIAGAEALLEQSGTTGLDVLTLDALNIGGLWRAAAERRDSGKPGFVIFYFAAAAFAMSNPMLWFEALLAVQEETEDPNELAELQASIILTAVQEGGNSFREFVLEDDYVPDDARQQLLDLIDHAPTPDRGDFVVRSDGKVINI